GMLGAGLMGEGIAEVSINNGMNVLLKDINQDMLTQAKKNIWKALSKKVKYKTLNKADSEQIINNVNTSLTYGGYDNADMVIEAVFEDLDLKHKVLADTEAVIKDDCVFASNTSALPISAIAEKAKVPERIIGMHYFSPVQKMPLLEIVVTDQTADWVTATALDVGIRQGKTCIVVKDGPGFYTTRILAPYMNEALLLLEEGADMLILDKTMKQFGFPVGPITLMDEVGIDVGAHINRGELRTFFDQRAAESSNVMAELEKAGFKGRKNQKGFLQYDPKTGKKVRGKANEEIYKFFGGSNRKSISTDEIQQRMALIMVNEAALCLQEGIIKEPRDGDIGAVFGLGFPPFRGGPFRYVDQEGAQSIVDQMKQLGDKGKRFTPPDILIEHAKSNKKFYSS
ncbi:MAG: 3-hydroxyacyl-CoA dehydrogenase NAD-binding domain-containing protein, partial [Bacteroidota bacterium]